MRQSNLPGINPEFMVLEGKLGLLNCVRRSSAKLRSDVARFVYVTGRALSREHVAKREARR